MKVYVYKRNYEKRTRERVDIINDVVSVNEFYDSFFIHHNETVTHIDKEKFMITVFGY